MKIADNILVKWWEEDVCSNCSILLTIVGIINRASDSQQHTIVVIIPLIHRILFKFMPWIYEPFITTEFMVYCFRIGEHFNQNQRRFHWDRSTLLTSFILFFFLRRFVSILMKQVSVAYSIISELLTLASDANADQNRICSMRSAAIKWK